MYNTILVCQRQTVTGLFSRKKHVIIVFWYKLFTNTHRIRGIMASEAYNKIRDVVRSQNFWELRTIECKHNNKCAEPCDAIHECKHQCSDVADCIRPETNEEICYSCFPGEIDITVTIEPNYKSYADRVTVGDMVFHRTHEYSSYMKITKDERKFNEQMWELWADSLGGNLYF